MGKDENFAWFLSLLATAAESDEDAEIHRLGTKLLAEIHIDPRFAHLPGNIWHDADLTVH